MPCPICNEPTDDTNLCNQCKDQSFYTDSTKETRYRLTVEKYITKLKADYGDDFKPDFHKPMIEQLVRCQIQMEHYEQLIANDKESPTIIELLSRERTHWRSLADKLQITIRSIRGDTKNVKMDASTDFREYMENLLKQEIPKDNED